jgi:hypothetical protein
MIVPLLYPEQIVHNHEVIINSEFNTRMSFKDPKMNLVYVIEMYEPWTYGG